MNNSEFKNMDIYNCAFYSNDYVYSVDKVKVRFNLTEKEAVSLDEDPYGFLEEFSNAEYKGLNTGNGNYRHTYVLTYAGNCKVTVKFNKNVLNGVYEGVIEFNPNKCFSYKRFLRDFKKIMSKTETRYIALLDIAIDIPVKKDLVRLQKDKRALFSYVSSKKHRTEYLGRNRNTPGRVKVYDKQRESKLRYPLTRIEITLGNPCAPDWLEHVRKKLPTVYVGEYKASAMQDFDKLSSTQQVLVTLLNNSPEKIEIFNSLSKSMQDKLRQFVMSNEKKFDFDISAICAVVAGLYETLFDINILSTT